MDTVIDMTDMTPEEQDAAWELFLGEIRDAGSVRQWISDGEPCAE